jgi:hypothetical protein
MRLVVGCTLAPREADEIEKGYMLRELVESGWADRLALSVDDAEARRRLRWFARAAWGGSDAWRESS